MALSHLSGHCYQGGDKVSTTSVVTYHSNQAVDCYRVDLRSSVHQFF